MQVQSLLLSGSGEDLEWVHDGEIIIHEQMNKSPQ
jgi:hypothetical protein